MDPMIDLIPILQDPQTTLETLLKNDFFLISLKKSLDQNNLFDFLCRDGNPEKILNYALLNSMNIDDFKTIHSCSISIITSSYLNDYSLKSRFFANFNFKQLLINFPKSEFLHNNLICANYSKIIETFICYLYKFPSEHKIILDDFDFLPTFFINNINILSFYKLLIKLTISFPELIYRNEDLFISMIESNSDDINKLFFSLQAILHILNEKSSLYSLMENEKFGNIILKIGITNYEVHPLISTQAFDIFYTIKEKSNENLFSNLIINIEFSFTQFNSATANALRLFPKNVENFLIHFFELRCSTFLSDKILTAFRSLKKQDISELITKYHINNLIMQNFSDYISTKTNGHFLELSKFVCDSKIICCSEHEIEWNLFVLQKLNPRKIQANKKTETKISNEKKLIDISILKQNIRPRK